MIRRFIQNRQPSLLFFRNNSFDTKITSSDRSGLWCAKHYVKLVDGGIALSLLKWALFGAASKTKF
jgi:hypothetical protein